MRRAALQVTAGFTRVWNYVRAVMGDQAYERYLEVAKRDGRAPLSAEAFYLDSVQRKYSTVSRCC